VRGGDHLANREVDMITYSQLATLLGPDVCRYMGEDQVANVVRGLNELHAGPLVRIRGHNLDLIHEGPVSLSEVAR
jgi:hypothetical protein